ncbi:MAG: potassium channel family protein [Actinobacteria bacterium]|nr:potassium channel family protein [Actinomycetota bacterium]
MLSVGTLIVALAVLDALSTTLAASTAAGPITSKIGGGIWRVGRRIASGPRSPLLVLMGPVIVVSTVATWLFLLWMGWTLVFSSDVSAVVSTATGQPADWWARTYFAAYSLFTLGLGDYVPHGAPWQLATSLALVNGLGLTTLAITYLVPVVTAVTERRQQASTISALGTDAQAIVASAWDGASLRFLDQPLFTLSQQIALTTQRHLSYPILHFYHSRSRAQEFAVSIAALDEALTIITEAVDVTIRPHPAALGAARTAVRDLLAVVGSTFHEPASQTPPPPDLTPLRQIGLPVMDDDRFAARLDELAGHRARLLAFATGSTWPWSQAVEARTD